MSPSDTRYPSDGPDSLLCQTRRLPSFPHGSGEEAELKLAAAFGRLSGVLRRSVFPNCQNVVQLHDNLVTSFPLYLGDMKANILISQEKRWYPKT